MHTELGSWQRAWRRVGKAEVEVEVDADMVEEKLEEEAEEGGEGGGGRGRGGQLAEEENNSDNITTLTWQVGKKHETIAIARTSSVAQKIS